MRDRDAEADGFDAPLVTPDEPASRRRTARLVTMGAAALVGLAAVAVPIALRSHHTDQALPPTTTLPSTPTTSGAPRPAITHNDRHAVAIVAAALGATNAKGSYKATFSQATKPGTANPSNCSVPRSTAVLRSSGATTGTAAADTATTWYGYACVPTNFVVTVTGVATINVAPFAMHSALDVSTLGKVTVVVDGTHVWEYGGANYGNNGTVAGPGAPLSQFATLVDGTLGDRQGALSMMTLASPTGYLDITQSAVAGAQRVGTDVVDGVPVTIYQVAIDLGQLAHPDGVTPDEATAIANALVVLQREGFHQSVEDVSVGTDGLIRRIHSVANFSDGGTVTNDTTFSDFGCAGTVVTPEPGAPLPPIPASTCAVSP